MSETSCGSIQHTPDFWPARHDTVDVGMWREPCQKVWFFPTTRHHNHLLDEMFLTWVRLLKEHHLIGEGCNGEITQNPTDPISMTHHLIKKGMCTNSKHPDPVKQHKKLSYRNSNINVRATLPTFLIKGFYQEDVAVPDVWDPNGAKGKQNSNNGI